MHDAHPPPISDPIDHRQLGRQLDLFTSNELVGAGLPPLWLPDGAAIREQLEHFIVELERDAGYRRVCTPVLGKRELYERSGHWQHFRGVGSLSGGAGPARVSWNEAPRTFRRWTSAASSSCCDQATARTTS